MRRSRRPRLCRTRERHETGLREHRENDLNALERPVRTGQAHSISATPFKSQACSIRMARKSFTLVSVGPVITESPRAEKKL